MALYSPSKVLSKFKSGGTTKKNNAPVVHYDPNKDYQAAINDAVAKNDFETAAKEEQARNAKITAMGGGYMKTNNYSQYLNSSGKTGSSSGVSPGSTNSQYTGYTPKGTYNDAGIPDYAASQIKYLQDLYTTSKANGDMDTANKAHADAEAIRAEYGYSGGDDGSEFIYLPREQFQYEEPQPTYENKYDPEIDRLLSQILNRDAFSYNVEEDPLFQQYKQMYMREGDRAMRETMAEAVAGAGGMNTYAMTAASQANNYYNSMLNDKIPELYQAAYDKYLKDIDMKINDLGLIQRMDETQYNRYRDTMNDWYNDRNFAYGMYRDDIGDSQWQQQFDYNVGRDAVADSQWDKTFDYNAGRDEVLDSQWEKVFAYDAEGRLREWKKEDQETAKEEVWKYIERAIMPSTDLIKAAGMDEEMVKLAVEEKTPFYEKVYSGKYGPLTYAGSAPPSTDNGYTLPVTEQVIEPDETIPQEEEPVAPPVEGDGFTNVSGLGLGPISNDSLLRLIQSGAIIVNEEGKYKWADGYGPGNASMIYTNQASPLGML